MPPGRPWAYGNMSMRNPMSRAPMNNNPMGYQASMTYNPTPNPSGYMTDSTSNQTFSNFRGSVYQNQSRQADAIRQFNQSGNPLLRNQPRAFPNPVGGDPQNSQFGGREMSLAGLAIRPGAGMLRRSPQRPQAAPIAPMSQLAGMALGTPTVPTPSLIGQPERVGMGGFQARMKAASDAVPPIRSRIQSNQVDLGGMGQFQTRSRVTENFPRIGETTSYDVAPGTMTGVGRGQLPMLSQRAVGSIQRTMAGDSIFGQDGIGVQRAARNVLMGQPMGADTRMRGLNIPGMTFDPNTNSMVRAPRPQLNPGVTALAGRMAGDRETGMSQDRRDALLNTRISRMARARGVRGQDIAEWSRLSPAAIAMRQRAGQMPSSPGPAGGNPVPMGPSQPVMTAAPATGAPAVTPPAVPPANQPVQQAVQEESPEMRYRRERDAQYFNRAMELQNTAGMSLAGQVIGGVSLGANRMLSQARDGYTSLLQGTPPDSPYAEQSEDQRIKRFLNMPSGTQPAPELPMRARLEQPRMPEPWRRVMYPQTRSYAGR